MVLGVGLWLGVSAWCVCVVCRCCHIPCAVGQGGSGRKAPQVEMGTQGKDEVDYNWLPPSTLAAQS